MPRPRRADAVAGTATEGRRPPASVVLRALREGRGVSQAGWAALLGYGTTTVRRWEAGTTAPTAEAETAIVAVCEGRGLFRRYDTGPLRGLTLTQDLLRAVLAEARIAASDARRTPPVAVAAGERTPPPSAPSDDPCVLSPSNLPAALTSFVGREGVLAAIRRLLVTPVGDGGTRLLTLTGAGGCGKTRLALALATALHAEQDERGPRYPDGVWLVELAALPAERSGSGGDEAGHQQAGDAAPARFSLLGADLVTRTVAATLGIREQSGRPLLATLVEHLQERRLLLVVDNCEHLVASSAALIEAVLRAGSGVQVLATSREVLRVAGESVSRVPSLAVPTAERGATPNGGISAEVRTVESVQLFVHRATAASSEWSLTEDDQAAVVSICRRLDGIPLALELAAARVRTLSVAQIAARLDDRFRLLVGGERTLARHETLRACIDWSHDLLTAEEQILFRRLAVFAGGFDLDAAEAVCGGEGLDPDDVFDLLVALGEKSMVIAEVQGDATRYRLLETIRAYADERLTLTPDSAGAGQRETLRERHAGWYARLARRAAPALRSSERAAAMRLLDLERDNLRAVLIWADGQGQPALGLEVAAALGHYWEGRGALSEGRAWLDGLLARAEAVPADIRGEALFHAGVFAYRQGDSVAARGRGEAWLALSRERGDDRATMRALNVLSTVSLGQQDYAAGRAYAEEALPIAEALDDRERRVMVLLSLAIATTRLGDLATAERCYRDALPVCREIGDPVSLASMLSGLGTLYKEQRRYTEGRAAFEESLALAREMGHMFGASVCLHNLAGLAFGEGDWAGSAALLREALALRRETGNLPGVATSLWRLAETARAAGDWATARAAATEALTVALSITLQPTIAGTLFELGAIAAGEGRWMRAAHLFGAGDAALGADGYSEPDDVAEREVVSTRIRDALGESTATAAWQVGRDWTQAEAIAFALGDDEGDASAAPDPPAPAAASLEEPTVLPDGLSAREAEVLAMLAAGWATREIAARLVLSPRTIENHIGSIYAKTGARNRADATAYALRHGLA